MKTNRRDFLKETSMLSAGVSLVFPDITDKVFFQYRQGPKEHMIVIGHADIWEFNARFSNNRKGSQNSPLKDFIMNRYIEGGVNVVITPAGGVSVEQRMGSDQVLEGCMRVIDMLNNEIEKTNGKVSLILTKKDVPDTPDTNHLKFFLDLEGADPICVNGQPRQYYPECDFALLRNFFRCGVRGVQLTHNGRNQAAEGSFEGAMGNRLSKTFGVPLIQEMNRLGMLIGVSHCSANAIFHAAEISTKPIVSTHQNPKAFFNNADLPHSDDEIKAIASTGGLMGMRYIAGQTPYSMCVEIIDYVAELVGIEHVGIGWLGHDIENPSPNYVRGLSQGPQPGGEIEQLTKYEQNSRFIDMLYKRNYSEKHVEMIMGGNFLRILKEVLPD